MKNKIYSSVIALLFMIIFITSVVNISAATTNPVLPDTAFTLPVPVDAVLNQLRLYGEDKGTSTYTGYAHVGVDMLCGYVDVYPALPSGQSGTIVTSGWDNAYGNYVVIQHNTGTNSNNLYTLYAHLNSRTVSVNDSVSRTTKLGVAGTTGNSTGVHLHFEVRYRNNSYGSVLNPEMFFSRSKVSGRGVLYGYVYGNDTYSISNVKITGLSKDSAVVNPKTYGSSLTYLPVSSSVKVRDIYDFDINYLIGEANYGSDTVTYSKSGYTSQTKTIYIPSGGTYKQKINLY